MSKLTLSKIIPARRKTVTARWCREWLTFKQYREARESAGMRVDWKACYWCSTEFADPDTMTLVLLSEGKKQIGNKTLCRKCADELRAPETPCARPVEA